MAGMRLLVVTAVPAERDAVTGTPPATGTAAGVRVLAGGVGAAAAATATATALAADRYDAVLSAGIGGGFAGVAGLGSLVLADRIVAADLGVRTADGFVPLADLGFGTSEYPASPALTARLGNALRGLGPAVLVGPVLTVATVTGTAEQAAELTRRHPGAAAEAMEGFGVATAAAAHGLPVAELRAVSNLVGPRDRGAWRVTEALEALAAAAPAVFEELCT